MHRHLRGTATNTALCRVRQSGTSIVKALVFVQILSFYVHDLSLFCVLFHNFQKLPMFFTGNVEWNPSPGPVAPSVQDFHVIHRCRFLTMKRFSIALESDGESFNNWQIGIAALLLCYSTLGKQYWSWWKVPVETSTVVVLTPGQSRMSAGSQGERRVHPQPVCRHWSRAVLARIWIVQLKPRLQLRHS